MRAAFYIDGFNLYHAVNDLEENFLKWTNLYGLATEVAAARKDDVVKVVFCSAFYPDDYGKRIRHELFQRALTSYGVVCVMGHYVYEPMDCRGCGREWKKPTEKETDINVALHLFDDAYQDVFDHAYLVSADSDQAATARLFARRFPDKKLLSVVPPGREPSRSMLPYIPRPITLSRDHLERAVMPGMLNDAKGAIVRPREYAPPQGWVHPNDRPKKSKG